MGSEKREEWTRADGFGEEGRTDESWWVRRRGKNERELVGSETTVELTRTDEFGDEGSCLSVSV